MDRNFYFGKDADVVAGSASFAAKIATDFATYGLTSAQSVAFGALNTTLQAAQTAAVTRETRTSVTVAERRLAIKNMRENAVLLAKVIYATPTVTDPQLDALGLRPRPVRQPRPVPTNPPTVTVISTQGRMVKIRISDDESERRGLPFGATGCNLYTYVGPTPAADPTDYVYQGTTTRALTDLLMPNSVPGGALIWISAQWVSARGQLSVGSIPVSFIVQGGPVAAAA